MMLISSSLDPRFKGLKFLSSSERASVFLDLHHAAVEYKTTTDVQPRSPPKEPRLDQDLLEYCKSSGESENGSSPFESIATAIDKEISQYKSDEQIESVAVVGSQLASVSNIECVGKALLDCTGNLCAIRAYLQ